MSSGEPQLDTRVLVMRWVQNSDGVWRTLDSRGLLRSTAALSEMYNGVPSDYLTQALGWGGRYAGGGTPASRSVRLPGSASGTGGYSRSAPLTQRRRKMFCLLRS